MTWDPVQYDRFKAERRQPFDDLLSLVSPVPGGRAVDLGCGTGELTAEFHGHLKAAETVGVDRSAEMLASSASREHDGLHFVLADIGEVAAAWNREAPTADPRVGGRFDVIFSNAALQWVPDHRNLLPKIVAGLVPGGQLAVQVPANFDDISHTAAYRLAEEEPFRSSIEASGTMPERVEWVLPPEEYARILDALGCGDQHVRLQVYGHHLATTLDLVEWMKGTLLTPFRAILDEDTYRTFLTRYGERILDSQGVREPYFFPFKRILMWARF